MRKTLILFSCLLFNINMLFGQGIESILAQLGARGATSTGGTTNYRAYLVLLDSTGKIASSMLPMSTNILSESLNNTYFIDNEIGLDEAGAGSIVQPFATLEYAITNIYTNSTFVFSRGTHNRAVSSITTTDINEITLIGLDPFNTILDDGSVTSIEFENNLPCTLNLDGIYVKTVKQSSPQTITIKAVNNAILDNIERAHTSNWINIYWDPSTTVPTNYARITNNYLHVSSSIGYTPSNTNNWLAVPINVKNAIDFLSIYRTNQWALFNSHTGSVTAHGLNTMAYESTNNYYKTNVFGTAAFSNASDFATAAAGALATSAVQPGISVDSLNTLTGSVFIAAGTNITIHTNGNELVINSSSSGGESMELYRYIASAESGREIEVLATTTNITASRDSATITYTIPAGTILLSTRIRWDGTIGTTFSVNIGTNDCINTNLATRWGPLFYSYREDSGAFIAGASARLVTTDHQKIIVSGLPSGIISHCRLSF